MADEKQQLDTDSKVSPNITLISISANADIKIKRSRNILERFCCGYLVGTIVDPEISIHDLIELDLSLFENADFGEPLSDAILAEFAAIRASYPVGIDIVGMFITQPENGNLEVAEHLLRILRQLEDVAYSSFYAVCLIRPHSCLWHISCGDNLLLHVGNIEICSKDIFIELIFRVRQEVVITWLESSGDDGLRSEINKLDSQLIGNKPAYLIDNLEIILHNDDNGLTLPEMSCRDIVDDLKRKLGVKQWPENKKVFDNVLNVTGLIRISAKEKCPIEISATEDEGDEKPVCNVPVLLTKKLSGEYSVIRLTIDAFVTTVYDTPAHKLLYMIRDAVFRQQNALILLLKTRKCLYSPFHFHNPDTNLPVTVMLPTCDRSGKAIKEEDYVEYRKILHDRFMLPDDRIIFRKMLSCFSDRIYGSGHLINPHEGLSEPDIGGGQLALVYGKYAYHHYMQDGFDDKIWGCAYRSLQTLASWFWFQGYTDITYPSHMQIQEALVAIGDKEKTFLNSKEWIGSVEVSYCLDKIYGVTSKMLHCSSGAEIAYKGRDLYRHFTEEGTPIMIGGGVLAHSIIGVKFNEHTGEIKFLIVDPHFSGKDMIKTVQSKGWVGWKGPEFWNQTAHYNLCMPQRPRTI